MTQSELNTLHAAVESAECALTAAWDAELLAKRNRAGKRELSHLYAASNAALAALHAAQDALRVARMGAR
jgi:hypothetical protein